LKVTKPKYKAPREVYVEQIVHLLTGLGSPGADIKTCSDIVRKLWNKCQIQDWRVCCKALYVFERYAELLRLVNLILRSCTKNISGLEL
jgi:hypothetical protein